MQEILSRGTLIGAAADAKQETRDATFLWKCDGRNGDFKIQIPNSRKNSGSNLQIPKAEVCSRGSLRFGSCSLEVIWNLESGVWNFSGAAGVRSRPAHSEFHPTPPHEIVVVATFLLHVERAICFTPHSQHGRSTAHSKTGRSKVQG
jgi:hypothetical protein